MNSIAFFNHRYLPWSETFNYELIKNIDKYNVIFLCRSLENLDLFPLKNIKSLSDLSFISSLYNYLLFKFSKRNPFFEKVIKDNDITILNACFGDRGPYLIKLKKKFKIPLVTFFYGNDVTGIIKKKPHVYDELFKEGDVFLICGKIIKKYLLESGCPEEKIILFYTGIDLEKFKFGIRKLVENEPIKLLSVGRFVEKKGFEYLIQAFSELKKSNNNLQLTLIGDGPLRKKIKNQIRKLKLTDSIQILKNMSQHKLADELIKHHIFILPTVIAKNGDADIIPNVLIEAQATGMPIISTNIPGNDEAVINGKTGFLVSERDINSLVEKTDFLIKHPKLWPKFGRGGRKHVENKFDVRKQVKKLEKIYSTLI